MKKIQVFANFDDKSPRTLRHYEFEWFSKSDDFSIQWMNFAGYSAEIFGVKVKQIIKYLAKFILWNKSAGFKNHSPDNEI